MTTSAHPVVDRAAGGEHVVESFRGASQNVNIYSIISTKLNL